MGNVGKNLFSLLSEKCLQTQHLFILDLDAFRGESFVCDQAVDRPTVRRGNKANQQRKAPNIN